MAIGNALDINFLPNELIYAPTATSLDGLTTGVNSVLITSAAGVPSIANTLPLLVQGNITNVGILTAGTWNANIVDPAYGGTGINNGASTLSLGGNLATVGAFASTFTMTGATNVTFPTSGTLATTAGSIASITGTANQIDVTAGVNPTLSISSTMVFPGTVTLNADPITALQATTKQYVDNLITNTAAMKQACYAASTAPLTATYNNGVSGVGATLTNAGTQALFTLDGGVAVPLGSRVLIKNQAAAEQDGIYLVTNVGSVATNWVLTRAADYDTPGEMQIGSTVAVYLGSFNANTSWLQYTTVTTVGVDGVGFRQFTPGIVNTFCTGRLTLTTGVPVTITNVTAATTVYFTPYKGNYISLRTLGIWTTYIFSELSIAVPATTNTAYDLFVYDNSGVLTLEAVAWTNLTTRATAIVLQNGVYCKTGSLDRRYIGSFRTTGVSGQTEDSNSKRYLYNYTNRVLRNLSVTDATNSWIWSTASFQQANASAANQFEIFIGVSEDAADITVMGLTSASANASVTTGIGINSVTVNSGQIHGIFQGPVAALSCIFPAPCYFIGILAVGSNTIAWLEYASTAGAVTWYGDNNTPIPLQAGMFGTQLM